VLLLTAGAGCQARPKASDKIRLGFLVKMPEESWFQNEWKFAQRAADKYGFDLIKIGATDGEKVLSAIDNLAAQGAQGFVICTPDVRLGPAIMARAKSHSMKVFSVDDQFIGADGKFMDVPYMGISARNIGEKVGTALYDEFQRRGWPVQDTAACCVTFEELNTAKERTDGGIAALTGAGFPAERIYKAPEKTTDTEGSFNAASTLLTQHPEVKRWLVFSMNDEGVMGAVRAIEGRGFNADTIIGIGIGGSTCLVEFQKPTPSGFFATCLISPLRHGYETSECLYKWVKDGIEPPKDTRTAGMIITRDNYKQVMREQGLLD
jgi:L-arabinose transport system substrate-binding protein